MTDKPKKITYLGTDGKMIEFSSYDELQAHLRKHPGADALLTAIKGIEPKENRASSSINITDTKIVAYTDRDGTEHHFKSFEEMEQWASKQQDGEKILRKLRQTKRSIGATETQYDAVFGKNSKINQALNAIKQRLGFSKTLTKEQIETVCASNGLSIIESSMALTILRNQSDIESKKQGLLGFFGLGTEIFSLKR